MSAARLAEVREMVTPAIGKGSFVAPAPRITPSGYQIPLAPQVALELLAEIERLRSDNDYLSSIEPGAEHLRCSEEREQWKARAKEAEWKLHNYESAIRVRQAKFAEMREAHEAIEDDAQASAHEAWRMMTPAQRRALADPDSGQAITLARLEGRGMLKVWFDAIERTPWGDAVLRENDPETWQSGGGDD